MPLCQSVDYSKQKADQCLLFVCFSNTRGGHGGDQRREVRQQVEAQYSVQPEQQGITGGRTASA